MRRKSYFTDRYIRRDEIKSMVKVGYGIVPRTHRDLIGGFSGSYNSCFEFAVVRKGMPVWYTLAVLFHEEGHHICYRKNCCCLSSPTLREFHAFRHCLKRLLELKSRSAIPAIKHELASFDNCPSALEKHVRAYKMLKKTKLFRKARQNLKRYKKATK